MELTLHATFGLGFRQSGPQLCRETSLTGLEVRDSGMSQQKSGATPAKGSRQDRLKQALRENLKRRKAQMRERSDPGAEPSNLHEAALDDTADGGADDPAGGAGI